MAIAKGANVAAQVPLHMAEYDQRNDTTQHKQNISEPRRTGHPSSIGTFKCESKNGVPSKRAEMVVPGYKID